MSGLYETKKYAGLLQGDVPVDKIALLALFIIAVLIAYFLTALRSQVYLSGPIKLDCAELSVSIPAGNGWRSEKKWKYQQNSFILSSVFALHKGGEVALVNCRYLLAPDPNIRFEKETSQLGGAIAKSGQTKTEKLFFQWTHIESKKTLLDIFLGMAQLPNNRRLDIEVHQVAGDSRLAERLFRRIIESVNVEHNKLLTAGCEVVAQMKNEGIDFFLNSHLAESSQNTAPLNTQSREDLFLIKDSLKRPLGFLTETLSKSKQDKGSDIQATGFYYLTGNFQREQLTSFQSDSSFTEFTSMSKTIGRRTRTSSRVVLNKAGLMTVRQFSPEDEEKYYHPGPAAIPDVFLEQLFSQMLDSGHMKILIDVIEADGKITPVAVSRIETEDDTYNVDAGYVLKSELLDGRGIYEIVCLDNKKRISKILLYQNSNVYTLERTTKENILKLFPERAEDISKRDILPEKIKQRNF